jgi:hypothetical protein
MAVTFAAFMLAMLTAHQLGDHWVQTDHQANGKGARDFTGAVLCARHVGTYTATTAVFGALAWWVLDLDITVVGFVAGQAVSALTHYWADRRFTLKWLARKTRHGAYYDRGGAYQLDQAYHWSWLFVAALLTAAL